MKTKQLVLLSLFIVLEVVFTRFIAISLPTLRIGFTFAIMAVCGLMFGVVKGAGVAIVADLIGMAILPTGTYSPGFTISAGIVGGVYGLLKNKMGTKTVLTSVIAISLFITCVVNIGLNTLWLHLLYGKAWDVLLPVRILKSLITLPIEIFIAWQLVLRLQSNAQFQKLTQS